MKILVLSLLFFLPLTSWAQMAEVQWKKCYGGTQIDYGKALAKDAEGFIYLCGSTSSSDINFDTNNGSYDCAVLKINENGDVIWTKTFGGSSIDRLNDIIVTSDSNILVIGYTYSNDFDVTGNHGSQDILAVKLNLDGEIIWTKCFGGTLAEEGLSTIETSDGNFLIGGESQSFDGDLTMNYGADDVFVMLIDSNGNLIWESTYGGSEEEDFGSMKITNANTIIVTGASRSNDFDIAVNKGFHDLLLLEVNLDGEILSEYTYGSNKTDMGYGVIEASNKSLIFGGRCGANNFDVSGYNGSVSDYWVGKVDSTGTLMWQNPLGGNNDDEGHTLLMLKDSSLLITGECLSNNADVSLHYGTSSTSDIWLVSLNQNGNINWDTTFGGTGDDVGYDLFAIDSVTYYILGQSNSPDLDIDDNIGLTDMWLIKIGPSCTTKYFADNDGDGFGDVLSDTLLCTIPIGYVIDSTDCNDLNPEIYPTLTDICNSIDDNCNGITDEDATFNNYFADTDGDDFGDLENDSISCFELIGYVLDSTDCNDSNPEIHPTLTDICNAIDDNCNGITDEDATFITYFADTDGDDFGDLENDSTACNLLSGYVLDNTDCDDNNNLIFPGAIELCNYLDDDCDAIVDDNVTFIFSYQDADADNFGNTLIDSISCELPIGFVLDNTDCNDTNPDIYPGAAEVLNGLDDDCDQIADEGLAIKDIVKNTIIIYPNPATNILFIQSNANYTITILNQLGEEIQHSKLLIGLNTMDIADFASGVYWVRVENGEMVVWVKE